MNLPLDVTTSLQASPMGTTSATKDNSDSGIMAELAGQFSSLLGQALNQQGPTPAPADAKSSAVPPIATEPTLETAGTDALSIETTENPLPDTASVETAVTAQPTGFAQNVFATLQALLNLKPAPQPEPAAEVPATSTPQSSTDAQTPDMPVSQPTSDNAPQDTSLNVLLAQQTVLKPGETIQSAAPENVQANQDVAASDLMAAAQSQSETDAQPEPTQSAGETPSKTQQEKESTQPSEAAIPDANAMLPSNPADALAFAIAAQMTPAPGLNNLPPTPAPTSESAQVSELPAIQASQTPSVPTANTAPSNPTPASMPAPAQSGSFATQLANAQPATAANNAAPNTAPLDSASNTTVSGNTEMETISNATISSNPSVETVSTENFTPLNLASAMPTGKQEKKTGVELPKALVSANNAPATAQASAPNSVSLSAMQDVSDKLAALNGTIEAAPAQEKTQDTAAPDTFADSLAQATPQDTATELAQTGLSHPISQEATGSAQASSNTHGTLPQFMSKAVNPTDQVVDGTVYSVKNGHKELIIRLNPDNLGEVRVNLTASSSSSNAISARLIASSQESHALLQDQIQSLKTSLEAQGIQIERLSVVVAGSPSSGMSNSHSGHQSSQHQSFQQQTSNTASQQDFNQQQNQPSPQWASQTGNQAFQHKSGFAQNPGGGRYTGSSSGNGDMENTQPETVRNNDGRISILA